MHTAFRRQRMVGVTFNRKQNNEQGKFDRYDTIKKAIEDEEKDKEEEENYENLGRSIRKVIKLSKVSEKAITGEITHRRKTIKKKFGQSFCRIRRR